MQLWSVGEASPGVESQSLVPFYPLLFSWPAQDNNKEGLNFYRPSLERSRADFLRDLESAPQPPSCCRSKTHRMLLSFGWPCGVVVRSSGSGSRSKETCVKILVLFSSYLCNLEQVS